MISVVPAISAVRSGVAANEVVRPVMASMASVVSLEVNMVSWVVGA